MSEPTLTDRELADHLTSIAKVTVNAEPTGSAPHELCGFCHHRRLHHTDTGCCFSAEDTDDQCACKTFVEIAPREGEPAGAVSGGPAVPGEAAPAPAPVDDQFLQACLRQLIEIAQTNDLLIDLVRRNIFATPTQTIPLAPGDAGAGTEEPDDDVAVTDPAPATVDRGSEP